MAIKLIFMFWLFKSVLSAASVGGTVGINGCFLSLLRFQKGESLFSGIMFSLFWLELLGEDAAARSRHPSHPIPSHPILSHPTCAPPAAANGGHCAQTHHDAPWCRAAVTLPVDSDVVD